MDEEEVGGDEEEVGVVVVCLAVENYSVEHDIFV
jgi:hypothetical protein